MLAAERLGVAPGACLVIGDTASGVHAGVAAGMTVWAVNTPVPLPGCHRHYGSLQAAADDIRNHVAQIDHPSQHPHVRWSSVGGSGHGARPKLPRRGCGSCSQA
ncbi:HAD hydrolase-like protein [Micromonospora sp. NBC_00898]|nr:HAD hydrolase-like protein [Micromonospora sp. NBC_00898]